jgi:hypothetical protein
VIIIEFSFEFSRIKENRDKKDKKDKKDRREKEEKMIQNLKEHEQ